MIRTGVILSVSIAFLALTGCSKDINDPVEDGEIGASCSRDDQCNSEKCLRDAGLFPGGYCYQDCSADPSCPEGSSCHEYVTYKWCLDACRDDEGCRDGYICEYGVCRTPCSRDEFCQGSDKCVEGRCSGPCKTDVDCPEQRCQDGKCVPLCKQESDCLPGFTCDPGSGKCSAKPGSKLGEKCTSPGMTSQCATGYCLPARAVCSIKCDGSAVCPSGWVCGLEAFDSNKTGAKDSAVAACIPKVGEAIVGSSCAADGDCASGHCYHGFCMEGCQTDAGCGALQCVDVNLILDGGLPSYRGCLPRQGVSQVTLGTFDDTRAHGFDIPSNAQSFVLSAEVASDTEFALINDLTDPNKSVLFQPTNQCDYYSQPNRYLYGEQISMVMVPNTPSVKLLPGIYSYRVSSTKEGLPVTVKLTLRLGKLVKGVLDVNWVFANLDGSCVPGDKLDAASATSHAWFNKLRNNLRAILQTAGLDLGLQKFYDLKNPSLDVVDMANKGLSPEVQQLFGSSKGLTGMAINIYLVRDIKVSDGGAAGITLGLAGGIPGPPGLHGTVHSGVMMSMQTACFEQYGYNPSHTLAHELGHFLGLFHNMENHFNPGKDGNETVCPCPCGPNLHCQSDTLGDEWCRGMDPLPDTTDTEKNLMYFAAESTQMFEGNELSSSQIRVMLDNPLVR